MMVSSIGNPPPPESTPPVHPARHDNTAIREAAQKVREALDHQQQKIKAAREAKTQVDEARLRLQVSQTEEQQAAQRVNSAKADEQQAVRTSQQQLRGNTIDVVA